MSVVAVAAAVAVVVMTALPKILSTSFFIHII